MQSFETEGSLSHSPDDCSVVREANGHTLVSVWGTLKWRDAGATERQRRSPEPGTGHQGAFIEEEKKGISQEQEGRTTHWVERPARTLME